MKAVISFAACLSICVASAAPAFAQAQNRPPPPPREQPNSQRNGPSIFTGFYSIVLRSIGESLNSLARKY